MGRSNRRDEYWFDAAPLAELSRRKHPLEVLGKALPGRQLSGRQHDALAAFAAANDLGYESWIEARERAERLPSLVLDGTCESIVTDRDSLSLEIGNHGWRFWAGADDGSPSRRGYIAIRHGLGLPHMYLDANGPGAATMLAAASAVVNVTGYFDFERSDAILTSIDRFRDHAVRLELPPSLGFTAHVEVVADPEADPEAERAAAAALLEGPAAAMLTELAGSFDIEVEHDWIYAYSSFGELSTLDPEVWGWAFGAASRLCDVVAAWGAVTTDVTTRRWFTADSVDRPEKLDGALRALMPKRGSRARRFLYAREATE